MLHLVLCRFPQGDFLHGKQQLLRWLGLAEEVWALEMDADLLECQLCCFLPPGLREGLLCEMNENLAKKRGITLSWC